MKVPEQDANGPQAAAIAYHNALMDIGATICSAKKVHCSQCPLAIGCAAAGDTERHTVTGNPLKVATAKHHYGTAQRGAVPVVLSLIHDDNGRYLVTRRPITAHMVATGNCPVANATRAKRTARH